MPHLLTAVSTTFMVLSRYLRSTTSSTMMERISAKEVFPMKLNRVTMGLSAGSIWGRMVPARISAIGRMIRPTIRLVGGALSGSATSTSSPSKSSAFSIFPYTFAMAKAHTRHPTRAAARLATRL